MLPHPPNIHSHIHAERAGGLGLARSKSAGYVREAVHSLAAVIFRLALRMAASRRVRPGRTAVASSWRWRARALLRGLVVFVPEIARASRTIIEVGSRLRAGPAVRVVIKSGAVCDRAQRLTVFGGILPHRSNNGPQHQGEPHAGSSHRILWGKCEIDVSGYC